ncbi:16S rRNA (cytidine(1402)-2'-O)-methyltransferase [Clostridium sp. DL1XJH146]
MLTDTKQNGTLYIVPTPIGNLKDITLRALEVLKMVDIIYAEDTRQSIKLLNHFEIKKPIYSYHKFNEYDKSDVILLDLEKGNDVAIVSDAGTPGISDPGSVVIRKCIEKEYKLEVLPGATAFTTALIYSGLDTTKFVFFGFIPKDNKGKNKAFEQLKDIKETIILYESPHRLAKTLNELYEIVGNRKIAICRELTKLHEQILRFTIKEAIEYYEENNTKGEFVIVLQGLSEEELKEREKKDWINLSIEDHIQEYIEKGESKKEAIKKVAKDREMSKSEIYKFSFKL